MEISDFKLQRAQSRAKSQESRTKNQEPRQKTKDKRLQNPKLFKLQTFQTLQTFHTPLVALPLLTLNYLRVDH